jgi:hypothetical protein
LISNTLGAHTWKARAKNASGTGPWSTAWSFTIVAGAPTVAPALIAPANGATVNAKQTVAYTVTVKDQNGNPIGGAKVVGQDEIAKTSFETSLTGFDGKVNYQTGVIPQGTVNGVTYNITFRAIKSGYTDSPILSRQVQVSHTQTTAPYISISPNNQLSFATQNNGILPNSQTLTITNTGGGILNWTVSNIPSWLNVTPASKTSNNTQIQIQPNTTSLNPDQSPYSSILQFNSSNATNSPQNINVRYEIQGSASSTQLTFGTVTIYANSFSEVSSGVKRATGNVTINHILCFSGSIDINMSELTLTGDCEIYINNVPNKGMVTLYDGQFNFGIFGQEGRITKLADYLAKTYLSIAGFKVNISDITLLSDGVRIKGGLDFKSQFGIEVEVSTLEVTKSSGLRIAGGITIDKVTLNNAVQLENLVIQFDQIENSFNCSAFIKTKAIGVGGGFGMLGGHLDFVEVKVELSTGIPIGATGLSLYGLGGGIYGLASSPTYFKLNADISSSDPLISKIFLLKNVGLTYTVPSSFTGNGEFYLFQKYSLANAYMTLTIPSYLEIGGGVNVGGYLIADAKLGVQFPPNSLVYGSLIGKLVIPDQSGWPYDWISIAHPLPWELARTDNYLKNLSIWGSLTVSNPIPFFPDLKLSYSLDCEPVLNGLSPKFNLGENSENLNPKLFGAAISQNKTLNKQNRFEGLGLPISRTKLNKYLSFKSSSLVGASSMLQTIPIKDDWSRLIFRLEGSAITPQTSLIRPDSIKFTPLDAARNSAYGISYLESISEHKAFWIIENPLKGDWRIENVDNSNSVLDVFGFISPISINVTEPSIDGSSGRIEWIDSGSPDSARISLYYDRDNAGLDGVLIAENIRPINGRNSYIWNCANVQSGSYYIYALIEDGRNGTRSSYSQGKIIVQSNIPMPSDFTANLVDTTIDLKWKLPSNSGSVINGFLIRYKDVNAPSLQGSFSVNNTNETVFGNLVPGRNYQFSISSIDSGKITSAEAWSNTVHYVSTLKNNIPSLRINYENALQAKVELPYILKPIASDLDGDGLLFSLISSPSGMKINSFTGEINWTPTLDQIGNHEISLRVADGKGGADSIRYTVNVEQPNRPIIAISRPTYSLSQSLAIITVSDNDANQNSLLFDEINLDLKYKSTFIKIILKESQANNGIFLGSIDLKDFSLAVGDTVQVIYINQIGETVSVPLVWEDNVTKVDQEINLPGVFELSQNYPNPFNPNTMIKYSIPHASIVKMKIYDILGREIATLINEMKSAGRYTVTFNATKMSSGVYFYQLQAGAYSETKKLLLLK